MTHAPNSWQARDLVHHVHPQTDLATIRETGPVVIERGQGVFIYDEEGREYIDGISGLGCNSLGYGHKRLARVAAEQMEALAFSPTFYGRTHPKVVELSEALTDIAPDGLSRVLFQCSGSEANDTAIKLLWYRSEAMGQPERKKIIGRIRGYHGNTVAAVSLSGQPHMHAGFGLPLPMFRHLSNPNYYRFHLDGESEEEFSARMAQEFEDLVLAEGPDTIAAFFAEPVMGGGGALVPPKGYWDAMQAVIRKYNITFLVDEVIAGFGRTGNLWASETFGLKPDMLTCAKALSAAHLPISALLFGEDLHDIMVDQSNRNGVFGHGYTYAGHPVCAAVACETLRIYEEIDFIGHIRRVAPRFLELMNALSDHPLVGEVRGVGLFCGLELVADKATRDPFDPAMKVGEIVMNAAHGHGLYVRAIGDRISCMPPQVIKLAEIEEFVRRLTLALDDAWAMVHKQVA